MGPTLQNLDACFSAHHSLSLQPHQVSILILLVVANRLCTGINMDGLPFRGFNVREFLGANTSYYLHLDLLSISSKLCFGILMKLMNLRELIFFYESESSRFQVFCFPQYTQEVSQSINTVCRLS
ncbi:hypothetical protein V6N12_014039 [Hibiscus sabdariffa]|uniref:Uncharacterized protein n=1 Tax=Hibiscus sabdariffa TaxID=183260 RepID=A0ABR2CYB4_9ROSI